MLFALDICVSIRRLLQLIVCIGVSTPPYLKNTTPSFARSPLKSSNYASPCLLDDSPPPPTPSKKYFFRAPSPPLTQKKRIRFLSELPYYYHFLSLTPFHLLKVSKFIVEISQFKFLVMTEKNIFL